MLAVVTAKESPAETDNSGNPLSLQNWQGCSSLTATTYDNTTGTLSIGKNTVTALTDSRDSNIYTVARLADGNCWMTENLRIDNSATNESTTSEFTIANTNNPSLPFTNDYEQQVVSNRLSVSSSNWCVDIGVSCINQSNINTSNVTNPDASPTFNQDFTNRSHQAFNVAIKSYGTYYNWYSATTGRGKYETGGNEAVAGDICPAGWHLPYGGSGNNNKGKGNTSGGFYYLNQQMGGNTSAQDSNNWRSFPNNFVYSGNWNGSSAGSRGGTGLYWSSTAYRTTDFAYILYFYSGYLYPGTYDSRKNWGYPVRCVQNQ